MNIDIQWLWLILIFSGYFGVGVLFLVLRDHFKPRWEARRHAQRAQRIQEEHKRELMNPDWDFYEAHLRRTAPNSLKDLYLYRELVLLPDIEISDTHITCFSSISKSSLDYFEAEWDMRILPIFYLNSGKMIYLNPGESEDDTLHALDVFGEKTVFEISLECILEKVQGKYTKPSSIAE